ncbi:MAG: hypothetical protein VKJ04_01650 [Vampirovibrionales bacterium]|nr:hypothetical protein [Vampirovibrionales bacterium]
MLNLQPLDIIVTRDRTPISWWLRVKTGSEWSHVCLAGENKTVYTTSMFGFEHRLLEDYLKRKSFAVYRFPGLQKEQIDYGLKLCHQELNKPYAYSDLFRMILQNYRGRGVKQIKHDSQNFFCSEFVAYVYWQMGLKLAPQKHKEPSGYTPADCIDDQRLDLIGGADRN